MFNPITVRRKRRDVNRRNPYLSTYWKQNLLGSYTEDLMQKGIKPAPIHNYEETLKSACRLSAISQTSSSPCCRGKANRRKHKAFHCNIFTAFYSPTQSPITLSVCVMGYTGQTPGPETPFGTSETLKLTEM